MIRGKPIQGAASVSLEPTLKAAIHNRFDVEVVEAATGVVKQRAVGYNTICNGLWTKLLSFASYFSYIHYGGGSGTPSSADTSLFSYIGGQSCGNASYTMDSVRGVYSVKRSIQLTASTAAGKTLTEVGIAHGSGASTLCTHAMLKDMNGNPISLEKSDTDIVNIYATVYVHIDVDGYGGAFYPWPQMSSSWSNHILGWLGGMMSISFNTAWFGHGDTAWYVYQQYGNGYPKDGVYKGATYTADVANRKVSIKVNRLEASEGNFGGIRLIDLGDMWNNNTSYSQLTLVIYPNETWFQSNRVLSESVGTGDGETKDFSLDFGFAKNARVYVDGVETQDFTLDYVPYSTANIAPYMRSIALDSTLEVMTPRPVTMASAFSGTAILYNPLWEFGISKIQMTQSWNLWTSDDLKTWTKISTGNIAEQYAHNRFWKFQWVSGSYAAISSITPKISIPGKALHFNTAPASGAVILADYDCDCIPKDSNHVFDMTVTIQLAEYTEAQ